jgi:S-adenosylmethionine decarboxylase
MGGQEMAGKGGRGARSRSELRGLHLKGCDVQFIRKLRRAPVTRKKLDRLSPAGTQKMLRHDVEHIVGKHVYGNLYGCDAEALADEQLIVRVVREAVKVAKATLMEVKSWKVEGVKGGVSVLALITESHIAVHTWPEYKYAAVDVFTCGDHSDPKAAFEHIVKALKPKWVVQHYADRSSLMTSSWEPSEGSYEERAGV